MRLRDNQQRANNAKIWIKLSLVSYALGLVYSIYLFYMTSEGGAIRTMEDLQLFGIVTMLIGLFALTAFIGSAITFIQWFRRAYYNAHQVFTGLRYSEGWAAGAWWIPIFNLFGPYQIASDFYKKTESLLRKEGLHEGKSKFSTVGWWWGFWVASSVLGNSNSTGLSVGLTAEFLSSICGLVAGYFVLQFIDNYSKLEVKLKEVESSEVTISDSADLLD